jgi:hypothetical protein
MVQKNIMTIKHKRGQRELTIADHIDTDDDVQAENNDADLVDELSAEIEDDGDAIVDDDFDNDIHEGFQSHKFDESVVLELLGMINMTLYDNENEAFEDYESCS